MTPGSPAPQSFPHGTSPMAEKVRTFAWETTVLGPIDGWPATLRTSVDLLLSSRFPGALVWGPELVTIYNDAFLPILGAKPEALGRGFDDIWREAWLHIGPIADRAFAGEATFIEDFALQVNRHGTIEQAYFTFCYSPVRDADGRVVGVLDTVVETTARFLAQEQLKAFNRDLERQLAERAKERDRFWQFSAELMLIADVGGVLRAVNPACETILGWAPEQVIGESLFTFVHPEDRQRLRSEILEMKASGAPRRLESRCLHRDGSVRWLDWTAMPAGETFNAVGRDVTLDHERKVALRETEELLRQSQKMEAVGQLTGGLAHDFNNLLSAISASLELVQARLAKGRADGLDRYLDVALGSTRRAAGLTHRLLAFSRQQTLEPKVTGLAPLIRELEELISRTVGPEIALSVEVHGDLWEVCVDEGQLENSLLNLSINARDAMADGGDLSIAAVNCHFDASRAQALELKAGDYVALSVTDTGCGMPAEVARRVFDPYFTTKPVGRGTGLGLSMVYGFARQSGGQVTIETAPGEGARFTLYLPRSQALAEPVPAFEGGGLPRQFQAATLLLVEDEPALRLLIVEVLTEAGYQVMAFDDGPAAMKALRNGATAELLITDVGLPGGMNGRQVADAARLLLPGLPVLFVTGYAESRVIGDGDLEVDMHLLTKPFPLEALLDRVGQIIGSRVRRQGSTGR